LFKNFKNVIAIICTACVFIVYDANALDLRQKWTGLSKEQKLKYTNIGATLAITTWGITNWDYGKQSPQATSEGWFGDDTKSGGADKLGHLYSSYVTDRALTSLYESWGYPHDQAAIYGAWSTFGLMSMMELGDSFSPENGFSYEDFIMNGVGTYLGYVLETNPDLARKLDLRIEYLPGKKTDIFTDYENSKYLVALKFDGFDSIQSKVLKQLELHLGYYTRGYDDINADKERNLYIGIGLNLSKLFRDRSYNKTATFLNYYQVPNTDFQFKIE